MNINKQLFWKKRHSLKSFATGVAGRQKLTAFEEGIKEEEYMMLERKFGFDVPEGPSVRCSCKTGLQLHR